MQYPTSCNAYMTNHCSSCHAVRHLQQQHGIYLLNSTSAAHSALAACAPARQHPRREYHHLHARQSTHCKITTILDDKTQHSRHNHDVWSCVTHMSNMRAALAAHCKSMTRKPVCELSAPASATAPIFPTELPTVLLLTTYHTSIVAKGSIAHP